MKYLTILLLSVCALSAFGKSPEAKQGAKEGKAKITRPAHKPFPPHWGRPPAVQTKDLKKLPFGFGVGSSTLAKWVLDNVKKDKAHPLRPDRPKPPEESQKKIDEIKAKQKELHSERLKLKKEFRGKSKEDIMELIKTFKEANKERHQAIKEAQKSLTEEVRSRRQTGAKRE